MKLKKGDKVKILAGKDKGKDGKIVAVLREKGRIVVEGVNLKKKHTKPKKAGDKGQIIQMPATIDVSNAMLLCSACGKATRVGKKISAGNKKNARVCKRCGAEI